MNQSERNLTGGFRTPTRAAVLGVWISFFVISVWQSQDLIADDHLRAVQRKYIDTIQPLLKTACSDCHSGDSAEAGFNLDSYQTLEEILSARKKWQKVEHRVAAKEMPPEDADPFSDADHETVMKWLDELLHSVDCTNINPGRVTLRRLNRTEYQNTVRDLLGVDYEPATDFPGDDVGYGFDNIADVISLPPILMEKYLNAAEEITTTAIADPTNPEFVRRIGFEQFDVEKGSRQNDTSVVFYSNSTISAEVKLPTAGKYKISIRAYGTHGGGEPIKISCGFDNSKSGKQNVSASKDSVEEVELTVRGKAGKSRLEISFLNDAVGDGKNGQAAFDRNLFVEQVRIEGPFDNLPASHRAIFSLADSSTRNKLGESIAASPESLAAEKQAARKILNFYASKAFRRRVTSDELEKLVAFYDLARAEGDIFEVAMRLPFQVILVSPHFLYKIEAPVAAGKTRYLSDFELATSLSYFLWSTMPDDELFGLAAQGKLRNATILRVQIKRMLADPRASSLLDNFVSQWLQLRHLETFQPDPDLFPGVDRQMRDDMTTETKLVFGELIRSDAPVTDMLSSDFTFVNERLSKFYGWNSVSGDKFIKVSTKDKGRTGLLTQASILTLTSNPNRTSPVKRGKWIMENLLGEEPPPPDPKAMKLEDQGELQGTVRQRLEQHRADPNCAVCHQVMDELGFALEHYDAVGRWRDQDDGTMVDATGILPDGAKFTGAFEMQQTIRRQMHDKFVRCLIEKMLIYSTGRGLEYFDECSIDKIMESLKKHDYRFSELFYLVVTSDPFLKRRGEVED